MLVIATDVTVPLSVCLSSVTLVRPAEAVRQNEMLFIYFIELGMHT